MRANGAIRLQCRKIQEYCRERRGSERTTRKGRKACDTNTRGKAPTLYIQYKPQLVAAALERLAAKTRHVDNKTGVEVNLAMGKPHNLQQKALALYLQVPFAFFVVINAIEMLFKEIPTDITVAKMVKTVLGEHITTTDRVPVTY